MARMGPRRVLRARGQDFDLPSPAVSLAREQGVRQAGVGKPVAGVGDLFRQGVIDQMHLGEVIDRQRQARKVDPFLGLPQVQGTEVVDEFSRNVRKVNRSTQYAGTDTSVGRGWGDVAYEALDEPARLTKVPMSSSNMRRPRVVAAGYDDQREILTVVFRDGNYYNYYEVEQQDWDAFRSASTTKAFIGGMEGQSGHRVGTLDSHGRGVADTAMLNQQAARTLYNVSRAVQMSSRRAGVRAGGGSGQRYGKKA